MPFWKSKKKKNAVHKAKPAKSLHKYEPKPFIPPEIPKIDISANQQKEPQKPAPKKASSSRADDKKYFIETFNKLVSERNRPWDIWKDFVLMTACAFSNAVDKTHYDEREDRYLKAIAKYRKEEQALFPELLAEMTVALEKNPDQDFLGEVYMRMRLGSDELKQIFTPYNVCHFMALATMGNVAEQVEKSGFITVHDDCCGGGATLIAAANVARNDLEKADLNFQNHILFSAQDIEETVALMCYIQLSLLGVAGFVKVGNSLTDPIRNGDSLENYWFTPMYFSDVWHTRRVVSQMMDILREERESNDH